MDRSRPARDRPVVAFRNGGLVGLDREGPYWSVFVVLPPAAVTQP
jgi:hypothetical protein